MSIIDRVVQVIREHDSDDACREPECLAQDLADAGLLMPDLPEPTTPENDPEWAQEYMDVWEWMPDAEWRPAADFYINIYNGDQINAGFGTTQEEWVDLSPESLRSIAYALLAAANY